MERRPGSVSKVLEDAEQVSVWLAFTVEKQSLRLRAGPALADSVREAPADFNRAGLVMLAEQGQGRARQLPMKKSKRKVSSASAAP